MKNKYSKLIVTGTVAFDEIMVFPGEFKNFFHPEKLHQINVSFAVDRLEKQIGGTATNITYNANLLIAGRVKIAAAIGRDGNLFIDWLQKNKINSELILIDKTLFTASGKVITDIADNQIWGFYYGAAVKAQKINLKKNLTDDTLLIISANQEKAFLNFQNQGVDLKKDYLYDPGMALTWIKKEDLIQGVLGSRFLVGNDYEIAQIIKMINIDSNELIKRNIALIVTRGAEGVLYTDKTASYSIPAYKLVKVTDPTGAGDAWRGGFTAGIISNLSILDSLIQANALASFAVEEYGTVNHHPTPKQIGERAKKIKSLV